MKAIPYLFPALSVVVLFGSAFLLFSTYRELVQPTVLLRRGEELAPANSYWLFGSIVNLIGAGALVSSIAFLWERIKKDRSFSASSVAKSHSPEPDILVARPDQPLGVLLQPLLVLVAIYQIPFVILFLIYREQWRRNGFASYGSIAILLLVSFFLIRNGFYRMAVGNLLIELDDALESAPDQLTGRIVVNRQSNSRGAPLDLALGLYEKRDAITPRGSSGLADYSEAINSRELYWQIRYKTNPPIENPFQSETQFPFQLPIPAWLPRPWSRTGVNGTIGMEWELEVSGRFAGVRVSTTFQIEEVPSQLKLPPDKRIKISQAEVKRFLAKQSILWERTVEPRTMTIVRDRPPFIYTMVISSVCLIIALGCGVALQRQIVEFAIWLLLGSLAMFFATLGNRFIYRVTKIQAWEVVQEMRFFGLTRRRIINRDQLASVSVMPHRIQKDDEAPHVEFDVFLSSRTPKETRLHLARIRTRLVAKAFAKAIADELGLLVVY